VAENINTEKEDVLLSSENQKPLDLKGKIERIS